MALFFKLAKTDNDWLTRVVRYSHYLFFSLTIIAVLLLLNSYSFKGYLTDKLFIILFMGTGMLLFGLYRQKNNLIRTYYAFFFFLPFLLLTGFIGPRLQLVTVVFGIGLLIDGEHTRYPIDKNHSIQTSRYGVLAGNPTYSLIESKYILFEKVTDDIVPKIGIPKSLRATKISEDSFRLNILTSEIYNARLDTTLSFRK